MDKIGNYEIEALISEGSGGRLYRAFDAARNQIVAIKVFHLPDSLDEDHLPKLFRAEAATSAPLFHQNIVTIYDYCAQTGGPPYLVMEYLQGRSLEEIIRSHEHFSLAEKISLMRQAGEGVRYAHSRGIISLSLKPSNVMVLSNGTVKLTDLGISRLLQRLESPMARLHRLNRTLSYASPEQCEGKKVDHLADIFAYGVIYYHLITGRHPFLGPTASNDLALLVRCITTVEPASICAEIPECPPALEQIILRAIHKDRLRRYQSFDDLQLDVARMSELEADPEERNPGKADRLFVAGDTKQDVNTAELVKNAQTIAERTERANALLEQAEREFDAGNLMRGTLIADQFFAEAVNLFSDLKFVYPSANMIHALMVSAQTAGRGKRLSQNLNQDLELARQQIKAKNWPAAVGILQRLATEYASNDEVGVLLSNARSAEAASAAFMELRERRKERKGEKKV